MPLSSIARMGVDEVIHGVAVSDPYRWLEEANSPETRTWIADQQHRYEDYLQRIDGLDYIRERVYEYLDVETIDQPVKVGDQYFYRRRIKGSEQACIYVRDASIGRERLLVAPPALDKFASVRIHRVSCDGSLLAYELKQGGADAIAIHIVSVESGVELPDKLESGYARGFTFALDQRGFYYCHERVDSREDHTIRFHRLGEGNTDAVLYLLKRTIGSRLILISDEVNLGAISIHQCEGDVVTDLVLANRDTSMEWRHVKAYSHSVFRPFLKGGRILAINYQDAPKGMLLELDADGNGRCVVIPEQAGMIGQLVVLGDRIVLTYLDDWETIVDSWTTSGQYLGRLNIPSDGTVHLLPSHGSDVIFVGYESCGEPLAIFEWSPRSALLALWHKQVCPTGGESVQTRRVVVTSKDGTEIPVSISALGELETGQHAPVIMTGYGGFAASVTPQFSVFVTIMQELGCKYVLPRIRGGGEYGVAWHEAGRLGNRQNAFDDFIAVAEWLYAEGETSRDTLAIFGGSNAGLLVGAVLTQRPELFGAVLCIAPLLDMVRYEKFDQAARWRNEYGSIESLADFRALHSYSPYHHVNENIDYPPVLFVSGDKDDRCNPAHVRKMASRLQRRGAQTRPILVDYSSDRGHSPALPLTVRVESLARRIAFLCQSMGISPQRTSR